MLVVAHALRWVDVGHVLGVWCVKYVFVFGSLTYRRLRRLSLFTMQGFAPTRSTVALTESPNALPLPMSLYENDALACIGSERSVGVGTASVAKRILAVIESS